MLAEAADNCNVCGQCGASDALALIWLELDAGLRLRNKKSVTIQDCRAFIEIVEPKTEVSEPTDQDDVTLHFKNDVLRLAFEKKSFTDNDSRTVYQFSQLEYNRKEPGRGFVITTGAREKSSQGSAP